MFNDPIFLSIMLVIHVLLCVGITCHAIVSRKDMSTLLVWMLITYNIPFLGALAYFALGVNKVKLARLTRRNLTQKVFRSKYVKDNDNINLIDFLTEYRTKQTQKISSEFCMEFDDALNKIYPESAVVGYNQITPLVGGDDFYPQLFAEIEKAKHHIHIQSFIIQNDEIGIQLMENLKKMAEKGIIVRIMYDTFGSTKAHITHFFKKYSSVPNMHICGWTLANPMKKQLQVNLRNHRKTAIIDGKVGFFGGVNFHKENITRENIAPIRDYHFRIEGPAIIELQLEFLRDWIFMTQTHTDEVFNSAHLFNQDTYGNEIIRLINTGPETNSTPMTDLYFLAITKARKSIIAVSPYFLPNPEIVQALKNASNIGVDVKIITPKKNNHKYAELAAKCHYTDLLRCGVEIYERQPPFMHAKAMIIDDEIAIVGSSNLDVRSLTLNYETNAVIYSKSFIEEFKPIVMFDKEQSTALNYEDWIKRPKTEVILEYLCNLLAPVI